jgi:hypothetical protein
VKRSDSARLDALERDMKTVIGLLTPLSTKAKAVTPRAAPATPAPDVANPKLDAHYTCQNCKKRKASSRPREIYLKNYMGPCADSFCFASCDSSSCRPVTMIACETCTKGISK